MDRKPKTTVCTLVLRTQVRLSLTLLGDTTEAQNTARSAHATVPQLREEVSAKKKQTISLLFHESCKEGFVRLVASGTLS